MLKIRNNMIQEFFQSSTLSHKLRINWKFSRKQGHQVYHGTKSLSVLWPKIWELGLEDINQSESLENKIQKLLPLRFTYRQCHIYHQNASTLWIICYS